MRMQRRYFCWLYVREIRQGADEKKFWSDFLDKYCERNTDNLQER